MSSCDAHSLIPGTSPYTPTPHLLHPPPLPLTDSLRWRQEEEAVAEVEAPAAAEPTTPGLGDNVDAFLVPATGSRRRS